MKVNMKNKAGVVKKVKVGFSWTTLFFGGIPMLVNGLYGEFFKMWLLAPVTFLIYPVMQCFTINKKYIVNLIEKGYEPATEADKMTLMQKGILQ